MKKLSLIAALTVSTMLSACGGGGGGHGGYVPPSTLPDKPQIEQDPCAINPETCMTTDKFSNKEKRIELYQNAKNSGTQRMARMKARAMSKSVDGFTDVDTAYKTMKDLLIDGNVTTNDDNLRRSLLLAGFSADELSEKLSQTGLLIQEWAKINSNEIKHRAQIIWDLYGKEKEVSLDNAKLAMVNIDARQDSFIRFKVDNKGKIEKLYIDNDMTQVDGGTFEFDRVGAGTFTRDEESHVYGVKFPNGGYSTDVQLDRQPSIEELREILVAKLYSEKHELVGEGWTEEEFTEAENWINNLKLEDFINGVDEEGVKEGEAYHHGSSAPTTTTVTYKSYAKDMNNKKGLEYTDFGIIHTKSKEGDGDTNGSHIFAGGLDAKRIESNKLSGNMTFEGKAVAALTYQEGEGVIGRKEVPQDYEGTVKLQFNNGEETLTAKFDEWYDVEVKSNANHNYDITFSGGDRIKDPQFKYEQNEFTQKDFVGEAKGDGYKHGYPYGAIDIGYYGEGTDGVKEAAGFIAYGDKFYKDEIDENGKVKVDEKGEVITILHELNSQIGFGAVKK